MAGDDSKDKGGAGRSNSGDGGSQRKTISLYDITSNDNPEIPITHVQLRGKNYDEGAKSPCGQGESLVL